MEKVKTERSIKNILKTITSKKEAGSIFAILLMSIALTILTPNFFTSSNLLNIARQISTLAIISVGMAIVAILGDIDLSVGSTFALCAVILAQLISNVELSPVLAIFLTLIIGMVCGAINGFLVAKLKLPAFVATLGTYSSLRGLAMVVTNGWPISVDPEGIEWFFLLGGGKLFNTIPMQVIVMTIVVAIFAFVLHRTVYGYHVFAVGGNRRAAILSGISADLVEFLAYVFIGFLCAISAILTVSYVSTAEPTVATGMELDVIASVVIGGCALSGGVGSILGALLGAVTIGVLLNGLILLGVSPFVQKVLIGIVIILAVLFSERVRRKK